MLYVLHQKLCVKLSIFKEIYVIMSCFTAISVKQPTYVLLFNVYKLK